MTASFCVYMCIVAHGEKVGRVISTGHSVVLSNKSEAFFISSAFKYIMPLDYV